jgi:hypothetical protein
MAMQYRREIALILAALLLGGCAGNPVGSEAEQCRNGLKLAHQELNAAKAEGLDAGWAYTKAAALLGAAKVQEEFGKYPNCIIKVKRARQYIQQARQSKPEK